MQFVEDIRIEENMLVDRRDRDFETFSDLDSALVSYSSLFCLPTFAKTHQELHNNSCMQQHWNLTFYEHQRIA